MLMSVFLCLLSCLWFVAGRAPLLGAKFGFRALGESPLPR